MKAIKVILFTVALLSAYSAQGAIYSYISKSQGSITNSTYYWTLQYWDTDDQTQNPCYRWVTCTVFIGHRHNSDGSAGELVSDGGEYLSGVENLKTIGEIGVKFKAKYSLPRSGTQKHVGISHNLQECVGVFYKAGEALQSPSGSMPLPNSVCGISPPPVGACQFQSPSLELDHQNLQMSEVEGHQASKQISVLCNMTMNVKIYSIGSGGQGMIDLRADGSLQSKLTINGVAGDEGAAIKADATIEVPVTVTSTLRKKRATIDAGPFSGSSTLVLALP